MDKLIILLTALALAACSQPAEPPVAEQATAAPAASSSSTRLAEILATQPENVQARYQYRHPQETLEYFGIEPGMTVVEALPGGGWYTKILLPYLGKDGKLIGADYAREMYGNFDFASEEFLERKKTWVSDWTDEAMQWGGEDSADVGAFVFGSLPTEMRGSADAVLFIRAMHNLARFEADGGYITAALQDAFDVLRSGGVVGIVQHEARDDMPDDWAIGENGYVKRGMIIENMEGIGFEYIGATDINANDKDQPTTSDIVWRLPPTLGTSTDDEALREQLQEVGESNRMTLKFRKP